MSSVTLASPFVGKGQKYERKYGDKARRKLQLYIEDAISAKLYFSAFL